MQTGRINFGPYTMATVGFDTLFNELDHMLSTAQPSAERFPPHNIIKLDEDHYVVEYAVAGFSSKEIDISVEDGYLKVKAQKHEDKDRNYLHKGISAKSFSKALKLGEHVEVRGATHENGILSVGLERVVPEEKKPKKVEISSELNFFKPQLLTE